MRPRHYSIKIFITAIIIVIVVIFLNAAGRFDPIKQLSSALFSYPEQETAKLAFGANGIFGFYKDFRNVRSERDALFEENNRLKKEIADLKEVQYENNLLKTTLGLNFYKEQTLVGAAVVGRDPYSFSNFLIINSGEDSGVFKGMNVVDNNGYFVGIVYETNKTGAKVQTIIDINTNISGIDQESRVKGIIKGDLNEGLIFNMVSQDEKINVGDMIITAPQENNFRSQPAAKVVSTEKYPSKPFQKIKLSPLANVKNIEKVFVIIK